MVEQMISCQQLRKLVMSICLSIYGAIQICEIYKKMRGCCFPGWQLTLLVS